MNFKRFLIIIFAVVITILVPMNPAVLAQESTSPALISPDNTSYSQIIPLGQIQDPKSGKLIEGVTIVQKSAESQTSDTTQSETESLQTNQQLSLTTDITASGQTGCYLFVPFRKWKSTEPWVMNATNTRGLDVNTLFNLQKANITKWEDAADGSADGSVTKDIIGEGILTTEPLGAPLYDGVNTVSFRDLDIDNAVAATTIWYFGNAYRPQDREMLEWDQVFNDVNHDFSTSGEPNKYDFESMSTHEIGLAVGLMDLDVHDPDNKICEDQTMYGSADAEGETQKSTLEAQDITGIWQLYIDPLTDSDTDGFADYKEQYVGTNPFIACGTNAWPVDFNNDKRVNSGDQLSVALHFGPFGSAKYAARQDIDANGTVDSGDQLKVALEFGKRCTI